VNVFMLSGKVVVCNRDSLNRLHFSLIIMGTSTHEKLKAFTTGVFMQANMADNLEIVRHIRDHGHESLQYEPYHFLVRSDTETIPGKVLITINYHQIKTKDSGNDPIIRQARGTIIDVTDPKEPKLVCLPFLRFYNHGQRQADEIDHKTAVVEVKHDGSLIKVYHYGDEWRVATRGLATASGEFKGLWDSALKNAHAKHGFSLDKLDPSKVYLFELVSPDNFIVVHYEETAIYHLGTRCMNTLKEVEIDIGIPKPDKFDLNCQEGLEDAVKALVDTFKGHEMEGVIVRDAGFNRVKVKSPSYLLLHHSKDNNLAPDLLCLKVVLMNEQEEMMAGRPDLVQMIKNTEQRFTSLLKTWHDNHERLLSMVKDSSDSKEFATILKKERDSTDLIFSNVHFQYRSGKIKSVEDVFRSWYCNNGKMKELLKELNKLAKK